ncbi:MAG: SGNH/GDSL hydrolase family protein [Saprospiraceae bacterium]|nr:SGNH/GDSL hydrolase family protein [Saprospiraceae bacterium]
MFILLFIVELVLEKYSITERPNNTYARFIRLREIGLPNQDLTTYPPAYFPDYADNVEYKEYTAKLDSFGFIQSETILPDAKKNIVFIGGSTTECFFVDDTLRFPSLVGKMLQRKGHSVNTFNSGVAGNHSLHSINILINKVVHKNFQVAVMMHNINDLVHLSYNGSYYEEKNSPTRANIVKFTKPEINNHDLSFFKSYSYFFRLKKAFQLVFPSVYERMYNAQTKLSPVVIPKEFHWIKPGPITLPQVNQFEKNLRLFIGLCRSSGIQPILMTQFNRVNPDEFYLNPKNKPFLDKIKASQITVEDFCQYYDLFNDKVREVAADENVLLIDLAKQVPHTKEYLYDYVHLNNGGSKFASKVIYDVLDTAIFNGTKTVK